MREEILHMLPTVQLVAGIAAIVIGVLVLASANVLGLSLVQEAGAAAGLAGLAAIL
jgi:uncharacterized membrane protein HdeD (DUF308 family)